MTTRRVEQLAALLSRRRRWVSTVELRRAFRWGRQGELLSWPAFSVAVMRASRPLIASGRAQIKFTPGRHGYEMRWLRRCGRTT